MQREHNSKQDCIMLPYEITGDILRTLTVWQEVRRLIMLWSN